MEVFGWLLIGFLGGIPVMIACDIHNSIKGFPISDKPPSIGPYAMLSIFGPLTLLFGIGMLIYVFVEKYQAKKNPNKI